MAFDALIVRNTRQWLVYARDDLQLAESAVRAGTAPFLKDAVFHAQQTAEKALKAFLTWHDIAFPRIHDLEDLGARCVAVDTSFRSVVDRAAQLSQYAWRFRYPGEPYEPPEEEAQQSVEIARETLEAITSRLPAEVRI